MWTDQLKNALRLTLRRLSRQRLNTSLHIAGLTIGMSVCLMIGLFLRHELSFDAYHAKADRIYRINTVWTDNGNKSPHFSTPVPLGDALREEVPGLEFVAQWHPLSEEVVEINPQRRFAQKNIMLAEPDMLNVFDIKPVQGDAFAALRKPYQALLTRSTAKKFYGEENPIGKTFKFRNQFDITVAGIIEDFPANTHMNATMVLSFFKDEKFMQNSVTSWTFVMGTSTYVVLPASTTLADLNIRLKGIADKYINKHESRPGSRTDFDAQPLHDIHFNSTYSGGGQWVQAVNANWLWVFGIIGLAVLILACINFINLSTAQALTRTREIGVSKALGAGRMLLIRQFMVEAWVLAFASGVLALGVSNVCMPLINTLMEKQIDYNFLQNPILITALLLGIALTGLLAGLYPAWILTRFNPVDVLKTGSQVAGDHRSSWLRKGLVVTQFSISIVLLVAVALMAQQVNYLRSKNLGFDHDNVVTVNIPQMDKAPLFRSKLNEVAAIKKVSFSTSTPSAEGHWGTVMSLTNGDDPQRQDVTLILADPQFRDLYNLKLVAGRFLEPADTSLASRTLPDGQQIFNVVINQKSVKSLGFASAEEALNKKFWFGMNSGNAHIVGVVADFNATSLHNAIKPILMTQVSDYYSLAGIKIEANNNIPQTIAAIEKAWKTSFPDQIFDYKFLDEQIDNFYKAETRLYTLFKIFALLAVVISCLGLYGLATFAAQQRTKEIGIRKVLGASVTGITGLLTKEFLALVLVALLIASPIAYYAMQQWLADFAYHIDVRWQVFAGVGVMAMAVAFLTVAGQSIRAATMNPVKSLRNE